MKKLFILCFVFFIVMITSTNGMAYGYTYDHNEIELRYIQLKNLSCNFTLDGKNATIHGQARCFSDYNVVLKIELQRYDSESWTTIKTFYGAKSFYSSVNEECTVDTGEMYRLNCTATVYDSNDKVIEAPKLQSQIEYN